MKPTLLEIARQGYIESLWTHKRDSQNKKLGFWRLWWSAHELQLWKVLQQ